MYDYILCMEFDLWSMQDKKFLCNTTMTHIYKTSTWSLVMPHGISNHWQLNCLFNNLVILVLCEGNPPVIGGFPSQRTVMREAFHVSHYEDDLPSDFFPSHPIHLSKEALSQGLNTLRPRQNGWHFADDIFKWIFLNENVWILIKISLKFVPNGPIDIMLALVQIMAWRQTGNKPLSEPMMTYVVNAYMCHSSSMS